MNPGRRNIVKLKFIKMKKVLFAAFACLCVASSITATSAGTGKQNINRRMDQLIRDTIPNKKTDTSRSPKPDTTSMPKFVDLNVR